MEKQTSDISVEVLETLRYIVDPEVGVNIVDLGLVYKIDLFENKLQVYLTLTTPGCPMSGTIVNAAAQILLNRFPNFDVQVELVWEPKWTTGMITEEGMRQLSKM